MILIFYYGNSIILKIKTVNKRAIIYRIMDKIFIRSLLPGDEWSFFRLYTDMDLCLSSGSTPVYSIEDAKRKLNKLMETGESFAIVHTETMKVIGVISVRNDIHRFNNKAYMLGYVLDKEYRGKGMMPRAVRYMMKYLFMNMGADIVTAAHFPGNNASKRVLEKCGFVYEGTLRREYTRFDGQILDSCMYSITFEEYQQLIKTVDNKNPK